MKYIKPPMLSMNFSENKVGMRKRLANILESSGKKRGLITLIITLIVIATIGLFVTVSDYGEVIVTRSGPVEVGKVQKLISEICSSPATASNPYTYINNHQEEFKELVLLDKEALMYMFAEFEKGNQIGLEGHIMREACIAILNNEIFSGSSSTGQEWYEKQREIAKQYVTDESKIEEFKAMYPKFSTILEVIDKYERKPMGFTIADTKDYSKKPEVESVNLILDGIKGKTFVHDVNLQSVQYALNDIGLSVIYLNNKKITKDTTFICDEENMEIIYVDGESMKAPFKFEIFDGSSEIFENDIIKNMISNLEKYSIKVTLEK